MKIKIHLIIGILLCISFQTVYCQNSKVDSLNKEIQILKLKAKIDSLNSVTKIIETPAQIVDTDYEARQDAFKKDFVNLQNEVIDMKMNLELCHKKFRTGLLIELGGATLMVISSFVIASSVSAAYSSTNGSSNLGTAAIGVLGFYGGIGGIIAGNIIMTNSHKYIGYAGKRKVTQKSSNLYTR